MKRTPTVADPAEDDTLEGCDEGQGTPEPTADADIDGVVLFADVDPMDGTAIQARVEEWAGVLA